MGIIWQWNAPSPVATLAQCMCTGAAAAADLRMHTYTKGHYLQETRGCHGTWVSRSMVRIRNHLCWGLLTTSNALLTQPAWRLLCACTRRLSPPATGAASTWRASGCMRPSCHPACTRPFILCAHAGGHAQQQGRFDLEGFRAQHKLGAPVATEFFTAQNPDKTTFQAGMPRAA